MKKFISLVLAVSLMLFFCLQSSAWSKSSLLMQIPSILAGSKGGTTTVNDNVTVIDENSSAEIVGTTLSAAGETELQLSGDLASSAQDGSILYLLPGADDRFPFGIAGKVISASSNADGTKTVVLGEATYADVVKEASFNMNNITLDASNFVGVIAPAAVEAASPMSSALAKSASDGSVYSFRDGAVVVRRAADRSGAMYSAAEGGTIDAGTVSLNIKIPIDKMETEDSSVSAGAEFVITGSLSNIKLTNEIDFNLNPFQGSPGLKSMDMHVDGDYEFDVGFHGNGSVKFGYFSQAWKEVEGIAFKKFGIGFKLTGLSSDDKIGKFPLAGLVFSVPCSGNPNGFCPVVTGDTSSPLYQAKALGVIVWLYLTDIGQFSLDGNLTIAHLNPVKLSIGLQKPSGHDFKIISSLTKKDASSCVIEALKLDGTAGFELQGGVSTDIDVFVAGVRVANAGADIGTLLKIQATWNGGYLCIGSPSSPISWEQGEGMCLSGGVGAGLIAHAAAQLGIEIDTVWAVSGSRRYGFQIPTDDEKDDPGLHGLWYYTSLFDTCKEGGTVISKTGRIWMDRNLGASRVATSIDDAEAFGDYYQWGRLADGHEKSTSGTTTTLSSTDIPGHGNFIITKDLWQGDWRNTVNNNLWQGVNGINNPCPAGFRLPTWQEWEVEIEQYGHSQNALFNSPLKLPAAGGRYYIDGSFYGQGSAPHYWSSTTLQCITGDGCVYYLFSDEEGFWLRDTDVRANGFSVRCIKD